MPLGTEVGLGPGHIVLDGDPAPIERGTEAPTFLPVSIVAKRLHISATAERLFSDKYPSQLMTVICWTIVVLNT